MTLATNDDFSNRELSIGELEAIAAGRGFPLPGPHLPPHFPPPAPTPIWSGALSLVTNFKLF